MSWLRSGGPLAVAVLLGCGSAADPPQNFPVVAPGVSLESIPYEVLVATLRAGPGDSSVLKDSGGGEQHKALLRRFTDRQVFDELQRKALAIYGPDDRREVYELTSIDQRRTARASGLIVKREELESLPGGRWNLKTRPLASRYGLCSDEPFATQPSAGGCSGFLVKPDVFATAGHCISNEPEPDRLRVIFGFEMNPAGNATTDFASEDVYSVVRVIEFRTGGSDWALLKLDHVAKGVPALVCRSSGRIADAARVYVVGHPRGLPKKVAGNAIVRTNPPGPAFISNLDAYGGNSGSPVTVEGGSLTDGVLKSGEKDFTLVKVGNCLRSLRCPDDGCAGETAVRTTEFAGKIP